MFRRSGFKKLLIWLLLGGIFAMVLLKIGTGDDVHRLDSMEPANPFDGGGAMVVELAEIHPERMLNVAEGGEIQRMALEEYVLCVLAAEMPATYSMEALKAQAVAARTFAVYKIVHGGCSRYPGADVCGESGHCQGFLSVEERKEKWGGRYGEYEAKLGQAVSETAGKIITYADQPILVLFHASSAGYTESVENVYAQALPYLRGVPSPGEAAVTTLESREEFSRKWFCNAVNKAVPKAGLKSAALEKQVAVVSRFPSGRVQSVRLGGAEITGVQLRRLLDIRSANFSFSFDRDSVIVTTEGYGHGVGMSQSGAEAMAREGNSYSDILTYYYSGVQIADMK